MPITINGRLTDPVTDPTSEAGTQVDVATESNIAASAVFQGFAQVQMDDAADVGGVPAATRVVGFQLRDGNGVALAQETIVELIAANDDGLSQPAVGIVALSNAAEGAILAGSGLAAVIVRTNANGRFSCDATFSQIGTRYFGCAHAPGGPALDARSVDDVTASV